MRFLANENFPFPSIELLRKSGYDVLSVSEVCSGISDHKVIEKAVEEDLIILTLDKDYGEIIFRYIITHPPSVIFFRSKGENPVAIGKLLIELLEKKLEVRNKFTVIENNSIRQRSY